MERRAGPDGDAVSRVVVKDRGAREFVERLRALNGVSVRVGILADTPKRTREGGSSKLSLVEVAAIHEFGAPGAGIPQRSFIRATADERAGEIAAAQTALVEGVLAGKLEPAAAGERLGAVVAGMVQAKIASNIPPPLKPATVRRKRSSTALIDTGQMRSGVTWEVKS